MNIDLKYKKGDIVHFVERNVSSLEPNCGEVTDNFMYRNGKIYYDVQSTLTYQCCAVCEDDILKEPDTEIKRIIDFFNSFDYLSDGDREQLKVNVYSILLNAKRRREKVTT